MTAVVMLVNGASASGKSRLIAGIQSISRDSGVLREFGVAQRFTTRAARDLESLPSENHHMSAQEFAAAAESGLLDVHWKRSVSASHEIRYGFALRRELAAGGIVVLSANNYLDWTDQPQLTKLRAEGRLMVVRVMASEATRLARLGARRPKPGKEELASRMQDLPPQLLPPADHVIANDLEHQPYAEWEFMRLASSFWFAASASGEPPSSRLPV
jgi:ribose 1,5-bisphosphokinase PhnN